MKSIIFHFLFFVLIINTFSQTNGGNWVWISGSNVGNYTGSFGTQGVASSTNKPPALYEACEWTDLQGNFWLYGGVNAGNSGYYGDLWKFDIVTNLWTWVNGPGTLNAPPQFGVMGVPSPTNFPGGRALAFFSWVDLSGDLWMYGGNFTSGLYQSDLWRYNIATNIWTWMNGPTGTNIPAVFGTQGVASATNNPGCRGEGSWTVTDNAGDLWVYGGQVSSAGLANDVWKYNIATNSWTWMKGSSTINAPNNFGVLGIASPTNTPDGRLPYAAWKDSNGKMYMFGGADFSGSLDDLWKFDITTNNWTWIAGTTAAGGLGNYSNTALALPKSRYENRATWTDNCDRLWMFGGLTIFNGSKLSLNDLWYFDINTNIWTFVKGSSINQLLPVYGAIGVVNNTNDPGGRFGAIRWKDNAGNFYVFGGQILNAPTSICYADLWKFIPNCKTKLNANAIVTNSSCLGANNGSISFNNNTACGNIGTLQYTWLPNVSSNNIANNLAPGSYTVYINSTSLGCTDTQTLTINSSVSSLNVNAVATQGDTCGQGTGMAHAITSGGTSPYSFNWSPIGGNQAFSTLLSSGNYLITVTDSAGCVDTSSVSIPNISSLSLSILSQQNVSCYNGNNGSINLQFNGSTGTVTYTWNPNVSTTSSATNLVAGNYVITAVTSNSLCATSLNVPITQPLKISSSLVSKTLDFCGLGNGNATISISGGTNPYTILWSPTGGTGLNANNLTAGNYSVYITDNNNCKDTFNLNISSGIQPILTSAIVTPTSCNYSTDGTITINTIGNLGLFNYTWIPNVSSTNTATNLSSGIYTIHITNNFCDSTLVLKVDAPNRIVNQPFIITPGCGVNLGTINLLTSGGNGQFTYLWSNGSTKPIVDSLVSGSYEVTVTDLNGCISKDTFYIREPLDVIPGIPNAFSPNNDGENDFFMIMNPEAPFELVAFQVYNRWGNLVFNTYDKFSKGWDGKINGKYAEMDVYSYYCIIKCGSESSKQKTYKGNVTLVK